MATDATGTPTSKGIPKYDPSNDAPSGLGFNAAMDAIDSLLDTYVGKPSGIATGEVPVWNGTTWVRSSVTRISTVRPQDLTQDGASTGQVLAWNGSIWAPSSAAGPGYGTSLPGSPSDGQEYILVDSTTAPTWRWRLRYNSANSGSYKWEFVGGTPAYAAVTAYQSTTSSGYVDLTTVGPSFTLPRAGEYEFWFGADAAYNGTAGSGGRIELYDSTASAQITETQNGVEGDATAPYPLTRIARATVTGANSLKLRYKINGGGTAYFGLRFLHVTPVAV
jgi:hypothetical protein